MNIKSVAVLPPAIVQSAVDLASIGSQLDKVLDSIERGEVAVLDWRVEAGSLFKEARKAFPERGPNAKGWGEFCRARRVSLITAARYIQLAEYMAEHPETRSGGVMAVYEALELAAAGWCRLGGSISISADGNLLPSGPPQTPSEPTSDAPVEVGAEAKIGDGDATTRSGRPPLSEEERRTEIVMVRLNDEELRRLHRLSGLLQLVRYADILREALIALDEREQAKLEVA